MKKYNAIVLILLVILAYYMVSRSGKLSMFDGLKPVFGGDKKINSVADIAVESGACGLAPQLA